MILKRGLFVLTGFAAALICGCSTQQPPIDGPVTVAQIEQHGVIGALGEPIGKVIVIDAPAVKNGDTMADRYSMVAKVSMVGDRVLPAPVSIVLKIQPDSVKEIVLPSENEQVRLIGYETCFYTGIPAQINSSGIQQTGYGFYLISVFVVLDVQRYHQPTTQPATQPVKRDPISIDQLNAHGVTGRLGQPLGKPVQISGIVGDQIYNEKNGGRETWTTGGWETWAIVDHVDGQALDPPVVMNLDANWLPNEAYWNPIEQRGMWPQVRQPQPGQRFTLFGYEIGGFAGTPVGAWHYVPPWRSDGQHFETSFAVWSRDSSGAR